MDDGSPNNGNWSLKWLEVPDRPHTVNSFAVRTPNAPDPNSGKESIEENEHETVKPES
jgi:hypothetical protein